MKKTKKTVRKHRDPRGKVSKKTKRRLIRRAVRHARKISILRGRTKRKKKQVVLIGTSYACKQQADLDRSRGGSLYGNSLFSRKGGIMPKKRSSMPWFKKKSRRGRRRSFGFLGADSGGGSGLTGVLKNGAVTVAGAAAGSLLAAKVPLPVSLARFRGLLPVVAGVALGMSKFGRRGLGSQLALGMIVAGGLAIGRQYSPQLFAGEDQMLGLPQLDQALGLEYQAGDDDGEVYQSGESVDDVELFGEFSTGADA